MLSSDKLRRQEGKTADSIVQFPPLTIRRFTFWVRIDYVIIFCHKLIIVAATRKTGGSTRWV